MNPPSMQYLRRPHRSLIQKYGFLGSEIILHSRTAQYTVRAASEADRKNISRWRKALETAKKRAQVATGTGANYQPLNEVDRNDGHDQVQTSNCDPDDVHRTLHEEDEDEEDDAGHTGGEDKDEGRSSLEGRQSGFFQDDELEEVFPLVSIVLLVSLVGLVVSSSPSSSSSSTTATHTSLPLLRHPCLGHLERLVLDYLLGDCGNPSPLFEAQLRVHRLHRAHIHPRSPRDRLGVLTIRHWLRPDTKNQERRFPVDCMQLGLALGALRRRGVREHKRRPSREKDRSL